MSTTTASKWTGSKHVKGQDITAIAKAVKVDIAAALKAEGSSLPRGMGYAVRTSRFSQGQSLTITVTSVPAHLAILTSREILETLGSDLKAIAAAYNAKDGDWSAFYADVRVDLKPALNTAAPSAV